jgi:hypothetical protein
MGFHDVGLSICFLQHSDSPAADIVISGNYFQLTFFDLTGDHGRRLAQQTCLNLSISFGNSLHIGAGLIDCRPQILIQRADFAGHRLSRHSCLHGSAIAMAQYHDDFGAEDRRAILEAGDNFRSHHIASHACAKNPTHGLIEDHFDRHSRVRAIQHGSKRFLLCRQVSPQRCNVVFVCGRFPVHEASITVHQLCECGVWSEGALRRRGLWIERGVPNENDLLLFNCAESLIACSSLRAEFKRQPTPKHDGTRPIFAADLRRLYALTTLPDLMHPVQTRIRLFAVFTFALTV